MRFSRFVALALLVFGTEAAFAREKVRNLGVFLRSTGHEDPASALEAVKSENLSAALLVLNYACGLQQREMLGYGRDVGTDHLRQLTETPLSARQLLDDKKP